MPSFQVGVVGAILLWLKLWDGCNLFQTTLKFFVFKQTTQLIAEVQDVFNGMLDTSDWLDYDTKIHAKEKLAYMNLKIGYPDYILDNSTLDSEFEEVK